MPFKVRIHVFGIVLAIFGVCFPEVFKLKLVSFAFRIVGVSEGFYLELSRLKGQKARSHENELAHTHFLHSLLAYRLRAYRRCRCLGLGTLGDENARIILKLTTSSTSSSYLIYIFE